MVEVISGGLLGAFTILLVANYFLAQHVFEHSRRNNLTVLVESAGGGIAAAYVFLELIPELNEEAHYVLCFAGFLLYYLLEKYIASTGKRRGVWLQYAYQCLYFFLVTATFYRHAENGAAGAVYILAMLMHVFSGTQELYAAHHKPFQTVGRGLFSAAVIAGALVAFYIRPVQEQELPLIPLLAGFLLLGIFRREFAEDREIHYGAFVVAAVGFGGLLYLV